MKHDWDLGKLCHQQNYKKSEQKSTHAKSI